MCTVLNYGGNLFEEGDNSAFGGGKAGLKGITEGVFYILGDIILM